MKYIAELESLFSFNEQVITNGQVFFFRDKTEEYIEGLNSYLNICQPRAVEKVLREIEAEVRKLKDKADFRLEYLKSRGDISKYPDDPYYIGLELELKSLLQLEWCKDFIEEYYCCITGISQELNKLKTEYLSPAPIQPQFKEEAPDQSEQKFEDPLFTLKGSPDEAKAKIIYSRVAGTYIDCSRQTFLHFFFNSAIQPTEECIKWIYEKSTNFYPLLFLSVLTTEDYQQTKGTTKNRWRNVNDLFGTPFRRDTDMTIKPRSDRKKYKDALESLIK